METETLTVDAEEQALRDLGSATDANEGRIPVQEPETPPPAPEEVSEPEVESPQPTDLELAPPETEPVAAQKSRDPITGKFQKPTDKPDTDYSRAQKEQARKDRSWQALQAEKEQFRQMTSQWQEQARLQQLEATRRTYQPLKKDGLTAQEYYQGAMQFERDGDFENAYKAHRVAQEMFQAEQGRAGQMRNVEAEYQWRVGMTQAIQANPEVGDPDSPIAQHLERIIQQNPWIYYIPQGFQRAAEVAHMLTQMASLTEMHDENEKLRAELEKYQRKSQPSKGGFASPRLGEKDFDDMSLDEQEAELRKMTQEADNYR